MEHRGSSLLCSVLPLTGFVTLEKPFGSGPQFPHLCQEKSLDKFLVHLKELKRTHVRTVCNPQLPCSPLISLPVPDFVAGSGHGPWVS